MAQKSWQDDPHVLERMEQSERLDLQGLTVREIGAMLGVSRTTICRDLERVAELRRLRLTGQEAEDRRQRSIAQHRRAQREAWARIAGVPSNSKAATEYLNVIRACEVEISKLEGTQAPAKVAPTSPDGEHAYSDPHADLAGRVAGIAAALAARSGDSQPESGRS